MTVFTRSDPYGPSIELDPARFRGTVLEDRERNFSDDSDFYVTYWNEAEQKVDSFEYATTRYAAYGHAVVDATPEVWRKVHRWLARKIFPLLVDLDRTAARTVSRGRLVVVKGSRKAPAGLYYAGAVAEEFHGPGRQPWNARRVVDLDPVDGGPRVYRVSVGCCTVVNPEQYETPRFQLARRAIEHGRQTSPSAWWYVAARPAGLAYVG